MTNFEAAIEMSLNNWIDSFPSEFALPEPTQAYKKGIARLMDKMRGDRYHKLTRNTARAILIAAIIMAIATVTLAATVGREFIVHKFKYYSTYNVVDTSDVKVVDDIEIGYIPEGFELVDSVITDDFHLVTYKKDTKWINIYKSNINTDIDFDTEHKNSEDISINAFEGVYYENPDSKYSGIIWNNRDFVFTVEGNTSKEELIKTAENIT